MVRQGHLAYIAPRAALDTQGFPKRQPYTFSVFRMVVRPGRNPGECLVLVNEMRLIEKAAFANYFPPVRNPRVYQVIRMTESGHATEQLGRHADKLFEVAFGCPHRFSHQLKRLR